VLSLSKYATFEDYIMWWMTAQKDTPYPPYGLQQKNTRLKSGYFLFLPL